MRLIGEKTAPEAGGLRVRRSLLHGILTLAMAAGLTILVIANLIHQIEVREALAAAVFFVILGGAFCVHAFTQYRNRVPVAIVAPEGLALPGVSPEPLSWSQIRSVECRSGKLVLGGARLEIETDPIAYGRLRLGHRFVGDHTVRYRGRANTVSLLTLGLDHDGAVIHRAIRRYWPPRPAEDDR